MQKHKILFGVSFIKGSDLVAIKEMLAVQNGMGT